MHAILLAAENAPENGFKIFAKNTKKSFEKNKNNPKKPYLFVWSPLRTPDKQTGQAIQPGLY